MYLYPKLPPKKKKESNTNQVTHNPTRDTPIFQFVDNRPRAIIQRKLQSDIDTSHNDTRENNIELQSRLLVGESNILQRKPNLEEATEIQYYKDGQSHLGTVISWDEGTQTYRISKQDGEELSLEEKFVELRPTAGGPVKWKPDQGLIGLLMNTESLPTLSQEQSEGWGALSQRLIGVAPLAGDGSSYFEMGHLSIGANEEWAWKLGPKVANEADSRSTVALIKAVMNKNGQMAYLRSQGFIKDGSWGIEVDITFYHKRPATYGMHMDTGGSNIFVNLIFNNEHRMAATEWKPSIADPSQEKQTRQEGLLPPTHRENLGASRQQIAGDPVLRNQRGGGFIDSRHAVVSWTDDLVLHSSPQFGPRTKVAELWNPIDWHADLCQGPSADQREIAWWYAVAFQMVSTPGTRLYKAAGNQVAAMVNREYLNKWFHYVYSKKEDEFKEDVRKIDWTEVALYSQEAEVVDGAGIENAGDSISEVMVGEAVRRRANSDAEQARELRENAEQSTDTRTFIRSWVRLVKL